MIRVAIVDDHPLFREGVIQTLQSARDIEVVAHGDSSNDALRIASAFQPDVMILDMNLSDGRDADGVIGAIAHTAPAVRILVLTVVADPARMRAALGNGADGYVLKGIGGEEFVSAVRAIHRGGGYVTPTLAAGLLTRLPRDRESTQRRGPLGLQLSNREDQILSHLSRGLSNKEIGLILDLSEKTIKHYVTNLFQKMQVRNRTQAAILAGQKIMTNADRSSPDDPHASLLTLPKREHARPI